jgi:hypothetical protein
LSISQPSRTPAARNGSEGESPVAIELRLAEVSGSLDVGVAEIKGQLAVLVLGAENDRQRLREQGERVQGELTRIGVERERERIAQERKDLDQERRIRALERSVWKMVGGGVVVSVVLGTAGGWVAAVVK